MFYWKSINQIGSLIIFYSLIRGYQRPLVNTVTYFSQTGCLLQTLLKPLCYRQWSHYSWHWNFRVCPVTLLRWPGGDIDSFFTRDSFLFLTATSFYLRLLLLSTTSFFLSATSYLLFTTSFFIRDFCFACVNTAGSLTLYGAGLRAGNMAAAMAGQDRGEEEQGTIRR